MQIHVGARIWFFISFFPSLPPLMKSVILLYRQVASEFFETLISMKWWYSHHPYRKINDFTWWMMYITLFFCNNSWAISMARCIASSVDGSWASWESWTTCSVTCDGGTSARFRSCSNPTPSSLGKYCVGPSFDVTACSQIPCPGKLFVILVR